MDKIFFDLDGTLNYFERLDIDTVSRKGFMRSRIPISNMVFAANLIEKSGELTCYIASSVLPYAHAIPDKDYWCDKFVPFIPKERRIYIPYGENKADYLPKSSGSDVFLDDYTKNLKALEDTTNLICIKVVNDINDTHASWDGARVSIASKPDVIADTVLGIHERAKRKRELKQKHTVIVTNVSPVTRSLIPV